MYARIPSDAEWLTGRTSGLPKAWADSLIAQWACMQQEDYLLTPTEI